jgi:predicted transport protein
MAKNPEEMAATMIANLKDKTGKTLPQWLKVAKTSRLQKHGELVNLLKTEHGMTHGFANLVAHKALASDAGSATDTADLVAAQYAGAKAGLRPIYDALLAAIAKFGTDVEIAPKKSYVSLRRSKQFGLIQPTTKSRVDVGINMKGAAAGSRLEASGSFNSMVSHRVRVEDVTEVDRELIGWLKRAYEDA